LGGKPLSELETEFGVAGTTVARWLDEERSPAWDDLEMIANKLHISMPRLLGYQEVDGDKDELQYIQELKQIVAAVGELSYQIGDVLDDVACDRVNTTQFLRDAKAGQLLRVTIRDGTQDRRGSLPDTSRTKKK